MPEQRTGGKPRVALVFGDPATAENVRDALADQVEIAYASRAAEFDVARLTAAHATVALVVLDGGDWLEQVAADLAAAGVAVVFDDPEISGCLQDWERARWARHLVAKLTGSRDYDPPRPRANSGRAVGAGVDALARPGAEMAPPPAAGNPDAAPAAVGGDALPGGEPASTLDVDTEALSRMIDMRLAALNATDSDGTVTWRIAGAEPQASAAPATAPGTDGKVDAAPSDAPAGVAASIAPVESQPVAATLAAAIDGWELVDPGAPVAPVARVAPGEAHAAPVLDELDGLELVPMEAPVVEHHAEPVERWMHVEPRKGVAGKDRPAAAEHSGGGAK
ncbi:MAG TPA: hypothetical protein VF292_10350 [Rhodanobacteraceae bacterium]